MYLYEYRAVILLPIIILCVICYLNLQVCLVSFWLTDVEFDWYQQDFNRRALQGQTLLFSRRKQNYG